jgi:S-DNA-T family DNA segregation ATPase FtsK/SpoIIIE
MSARRAEPESPRFDSTAFLLLAIGIALSLAVLGADPAELAGAWTSPQTPTQNWLGGVGSWLARSLAESLGAAVYVFLGGWLMLSLDLFLRPHWWPWLRRMCGWLLLIPGSAILAERFGSTWVGASIPNDGGTLGDALNGLLNVSLPNWASAVILCTVLAAGLFLVADRLVSAMARQTGNAIRWFGRLVHAIGAKIVRFRPFKLVSIPIRSPRPRTRIVTRTPPARSAPAGPPVQSEFELPSIELLDDPIPLRFEDQEQRLRDRAALLETTFTDFGLNVRVVGINTGPVITQYEVALETGLRVNRVTALADDLALNLRVPSVRVVAPIPGKNTVGIEVPNEHRATVRLKELLTMDSPWAESARLPLYLGKDTEGRPLVYDLADMPHLLIAGRTGTGKSVCLNAVILSLLMTRTPEDCKLILIDPKMLELSEYGKIPHLMHPVVTDMKKAEAILAWAVDKMDERYDLLKRARVRGIAGYNELSLEEIHRRAEPIDEEDRQRFVHPMPSVVIVIDEFGDLMMKFKKDVEEHIIRLAQKSRAAGIHLILATQKPTVDIVTGLIKSNLPARICFQVTSRTDSRVVLDEMGGERLLGKGDMLFLQPGTSSLIRAQGTYASDDEIRRVVAEIESEPEFAQELVAIAVSDEGGSGGTLMDRLRSRDELYEQAIEIVVREGRGSTSLLQRALGIGYGRAARLIDYMAEDGIVGQFNGSQAREVLVKPDRWEAMKVGEADLQRSA